jgi:predicted acetyltransferase
VADPYPIRPVSADEFDAFRSIDAHAFNAGPMSPGNRALMLARFEADRSLAAFDGAEPVGVAGAFSFRMTVPGAVIPTAGVSYVAVLPTYRRRGILRAIMRRQLADLASRGGEAIAALWASEVPLYGRYGYGCASSQSTFTFRRGEGILAPGAAAMVAADPALRLRLADPPAARTELAKVFDTVLPTRPGFFARTDAWWDRALNDPPEDRGGRSPLRCVIAEDNSGPRGYALYSGIGRWDSSTGLPDGNLVIRELIAADPVANAALWADQLSRDLVAEIEAELRPADDPVLFQLADFRRARSRVSDGVWVRIIDVPSALTARSYSCAFDVVLEITDELLPGNAGRWRLRADGLSASAGAPGVTRGGGVSCERTTDPADISLGISELGAAYLGGTRLGALAAAGLVTELREGTLRSLSAAMSWDPSPWCPTIF